MFFSYKQEIAKLNLKIKASNSQTKIEKLKIKITKIKLKRKTENKICKSGPPVSQTPLPDQTVTPGPTPPITIIPVETPAAGPTVIPTKTPTFTSQFFDLNGNATNIGKAELKIPFSLSANISRGRIISDNNSCTGCHLERINYDYNQLINKVPFDPMYINLNPQEFADLTAYLNRLRSK